MYGKGGDIKFAYGWVDINTPSKIPLEVVVGYRMRDSLMSVALKVIVNIFIEIIIISKCLDFYK